jgi:hypothetical protein
LKNKFVIFPMMLCGSCGRLCQKVPLVLACFDASAAPRPENSDSKKIHFLALIDK